MLYTPKFEFQMKPRCVRSTSLLCGLALEWHRGRPVFTSPPRGRDSEVLVKALKGEGEELKRKKIHFAKVRQFLNYCTSTNNYRYFNDCSC